MKKSSLPWSGALRAAGARCAAFVRLAIALGALGALAPTAAGAGSPHRSAPNHAASDQHVLLREGDRPASAHAEIHAGRAAASVKSFALRDGAPRFVLDFAEPIHLEGSPSGRGPGAGPVLGYRFALRGKGARLVFDLASPTVAATVETRGGIVRVAFQDAREAPDPAPVPVKEPPAPAPAFKARKVVVVDAGHGGKDSGAIGVSGAFEKDVTLAAARALRDALQARGLDVVLTRDHDEFLELAERVRRARTANADLFISLHADSSPNRSAEGASIYTLSERGGARAKTVAQAQDWELDIAEPPKSTQVHDILLDLAQRETKNRSADFAQVAVRHLDPVAPLLPNARRNAGFFVLLAPDVPAILLEMGFMTNATDESRLVNAARRRKMMDALADAAAEFLSTSAAYADAR